MSLNDELKRYGYGFTLDAERYREGADSKVSRLDWEHYDSGLQALLSRDIGQVTSRDQIIDPYQVVQLGMYGNGSKAQALYNADLAAAQNYAARQEAAYKEWYESPEQKVARERAAGRNPDLMDISGTSGAAETNGPQGSPIQGIPSSEQVAATSISSIASIIGGLSSVASLATSFSNIGLIKGQKDLQTEQIHAGKLANIASAESLFSQGIGNRLSNAISSSVASGQSLDIDSWFADDSNFNGLFESYGFEDNIVYRDAFQRARESRQKLAKSSYDSTSGTLRSQKSYAEGLADPTYDSNVLIQRSFMEPVLEAEFKLREARAEFDRNVLDMKSEYMVNLDVDGLAEGANNQAYQHEYDLYIKKCQSIIEGATSDIYKNWRDGYNAHKDDPLGMAFSYLIMNRGEMKWYEYLAAHASVGIGEMVDAAVDSFGYQDTDGNPVTNEGVVGWKMGRPTK